MIRKGIKSVAMVTLGTLALGTFVFGTDVVSYVSTTCNTVRTKAKDTVPVEFELQRARDMIEQILPELQANIRMIAQEEVEIASLEKQIGNSGKDLVAQQQSIAQLRDRLDTSLVSFNIGPASYTREQLTEKLAHRYNRFKESKATLAGKQKVLESRRRSLAAAETMLDRAREQKVELEQKIEGLVAQHRLIQSSEVAVDLQVDGRRITKADRLINDIQNRLDVAQRVIARQSDFFESDSELAFVDEESLLAEIDSDMSFGAHPANEATVETDGGGNVNVTVVAVKPK